MGDFFLLILAAALGGGIVTILHKWDLERRTYSLQCDVEDLKEKILSEIKKRASREFKTHDKFDRELAEAAKREPARQKQWWEQYTQQG